MSDGGESASYWFAVPEKNETDGQTKSRISSWRVRYNIYFPIYNLLRMENSSWEKCNKSFMGHKNRGKAVYPPSLGGVFKSSKTIANAKSFCRFSNNTSK